MTKPKNLKVAFVDSDDENDKGTEAELTIPKMKDLPIEKPVLEKSGSFKFKQTVNKAVRDQKHREDAEAEQMEKNKSTLQGHVSILESGLSKCLSAYRAQAEDELFRHLQAMEELQVSHDLELATLRTENFKLREQLGLKNDQVCAEKVLFQAKPPEPEKDKKRGGKADRDDDAARRKRDKKAWSDDGEDDDKGLNMRKGKTNKANQAPAGSWQPFVAWVPTGASMSNPEPWKPLTQQELQNATSATNPQQQLKRLKTQKSSTFTSEQSVSQTSIVPLQPGEVEQKEDKASASDDSDDDSTKSSDLGSSVDYFVLLEIWEATAHQKKTMKRSSGVGDTESSMPFNDDDGDYGETEKRFFILNPDSSTRIAWDLSSLFMVIYDMIMIPMFVFNMEDNAFLIFMDWCTRLFWTLDMGWSSITGVVLADGSVEYRFKAILKRYAKTWLAMDTFIVCSDYLGLLFQSGDMEFSKFGRVFRIVRVVRLLRLVRMQEIISNIMERIQSDKIGLLMQIFKQFLIILFLSHNIACGWWGIGVADPQAEESWVLTAQYYGADLGAKYLVCLHWALSQFSGGMDEVVPINTIERFYAVLIGMFAFMVAVVMLSTLTSSLTQQYIIGGSGARQMANLRKYLKQNNCPKNLAKRVCRNAKHAISGDLTPDAVELLNVISEPLKIEMHYEMYSRILCNHPFFLDLLQGAHNQLMRWICHRAMSMLLLAHGDVVFSRGEEPSDPKMYFVVAGELEYLDGYGETAKVETKHYLSEAALWISWKHRGTLTAQTDVKMALLDAQSFQDICKRHFRRAKDAAVSIKRYAADFLDELNTDAANRTDLDESHKFN